MNAATRIVVRPFAWLFFLVIGAIFLPTFNLTFWCISTKNIKNAINNDRHQSRSRHFHEVQDSMESFIPENQTSGGLARFLNATLYRVDPTFSILQTEVVPVLFGALSTISHLTQISFVGINGHFISLSAGDGGATTALFFNGTSASGNGSESDVWYIQPVSDAGKLIGEARIVESSTTALNSTALLNALNSTSFGSVGAAWRDRSELLLFTASVSRSVGVISLGFSVKAFADFVSSRDFPGGGLYVATMDGEILAAAGVLSNISAVRIGGKSGDPTALLGSLSCKSVENMNKPDAEAEISGKKYELYCSPVALAGVPSVYVQVFPYDGLLRLINDLIRTMMLLLALMLIVTVVAVFLFMYRTVKSTMEIMGSNVRLIKQMEIAQQAEKKSINKTMAIARASHDVRADLAAIMGLIDLCYHEVHIGSELETNLKQMKSSVDHLLATTNEILDTSKIEAGKMELHETEFNLAQLLEDLADFFHPVSMKKNVDVVFDPFDGTVYAYSNVRGDCGSLKKILSNLLNNAVKFTKEGHICIRAWARKPVFETSVTVDSNWETRFCCLTLCLVPEHIKKADSDSQNLTNNVKMDPNCMEFVFEVDDTGMGIPKEKRGTVFENYEQVKESAAEVGGTGLGLGIVRSLVQLMGGDIEIVDKSSRGACFKFNIFLVTSDNQNRSFPSHSQPNEVTSVNSPQSDHHIIPIDSIKTSGQASAPPSPSSSGTSLVILLINSKGRRKMIQRFLEFRGIRVLVAKEAACLPGILKKVKYKLTGSSFHGSLDISPRSFLSSCSSTSRENKNVPLTAFDGVSETVSVLQGRVNVQANSCVMLIVDANAGDFSDLCRRVYGFQTDIRGSKCCKVVWLEKPETRNFHFQGNSEQTLAADRILSKPLHGSRLFEKVGISQGLSSASLEPGVSSATTSLSFETGVIGLLPEFGGQIPEVSSGRNRNNTMKVGSSLDPSMNEQKWKPKISSVITRTYQGEIEEIGSSSSNTSSSRRRSLLSRLKPASRQTEAIAATKNAAASASSTGSQKPLDGKKILVVEDNEVQKRVSVKNLTRMGAESVETSKDGEEAVDLICEKLRDQALQGSSELPFHFILMDCQMPGIDGFEATRRIREEEAKYGLRIPVFALTAHDSGEIRSKMSKAGMDAHLERPLREEQLVEAIYRVKR